jgi:DNA (cytosine-5)-methyltransferase 1
MTLLKNIADEYGLCEIALQKFVDTNQIPLEGISVENVGQLSPFVESGCWQNSGFANPQAKIRLATMFSGIGAIEWALRRLGLNHEVVFASDNDKFVKQSYCANYDISDDNWYDDVKDIEGEKYRGKVDLLVGGSPCQSFSMVGKRRGMEDTRGTLFYEFSRVIKESQPKVFIYENVKGLLSHDGGNTFETMKVAFNELGYKYYYSTLNAKEFGVPQNRSRIFVVGFREETQFKFPAPIGLEHTMQDFLEDYIDSKYYLKEKGVKFVTSSKNRQKRYTQINGDVAICQKANQQFNWHGDFIFEGGAKPAFDEFIFDVNDVEEKYYLSCKVRNYVLSPGTKNFKTRVETDLSVARPLLQSMHKMHRAGVDNYVTHQKGKIRKLTPRECLRLMGFGDGFKQLVSDTQMYRQTGNSIVVDVLIALLKQMDITKYGEGYGK